MRQLRLGDFVSSPLPRCACLLIHLHWNRQMSGRDRLGVLISLSLETQGEP